MRTEGRMDGRMDGHAEAKGRFSRLSERAQKVKKTKHTTLFIFRTNTRYKLFCIPHKNKEIRSKEREKYRSCENIFWIQRSGVTWKDLPKARVQLGSLGNQVFPQWRSILKQSNNNQSHNPSMTTQGNTKKLNTNKHCVGLPCGKNS
jgi:hypothetical protein